MKIENLSLDDLVRAIEVALSSQYATGRSMEPFVRELIRRLREHEASIFSGGK